VHRAALVSITLLGCYRPRLESACNVACDTDRTCPDGLSCGDDLLCHAGTTECSLQDANSDGAGGDSGSPICFHPHLLPALGTSICAPSLGAVALAGTIDTDGDSRCFRPMPSGPCILIADTVTTGGTVIVIGSVPLAVFSAGAFTVGTTIDVASHHPPGHTGAGANGPDCTTHAGSDDVQGGGGGAGGAFGGSGGAGGGGDSGPTGPVAGGSAIAALAVPPSTLRGGCPGSPGGIGASVAANGGNGGGGIYLLSESMLEIDGTINASGGGAPDTVDTQGGGGGGAGGLIALEGSIIHLAASAAVIAVGGGGASGGAIGSTTSGAGGDPGTTSTSGAPGGASKQDSSTGGISGAGGSGSSKANASGRDR
jgi:hypothetical protein